MFKKVITLSLFTSMIALAFILNTTKPATAGPFGILIVFMLGYVMTVCIFTYLIFYVSRLIAHLSKVFVPIKPIKPMSLKKSYYFSTVLAAAPMMVVGLQSVGAIGIYEILLVGVFVVLGCVYIIKRIG